MRACLAFFLASCCAVALAVDHGVAGVIVAVNQTQGTRLVHVCVCIFLIADGISSARATYQMHFRSPANNKFGRILHFPPLLRITPPQARPCNRKLKIQGVY